MPEPSTPLRGRALALATLAYIEAHPKEWNQEHWRCGTACCFAGHAALLGGARWCYPESGHGHRMIFDGMERTAPEMADQFLGLVTGMYDDCHVLFEPYNSLDDIRKLVDKYLPEAPDA